MGISKLEKFVVAGLEVPDKLLKVVKLEKWTAYSQYSRVDPSIVKKTFGEEPEPQWKFYTPDEIIGMTEDWHEEQDVMWFGVEPYDIVPVKSVLIGELGYDRPFALDYRTEEPCVRFMTIDDRWIRVANSVGDLIDKLGIEVKPVSR